MCRERSVAILRTLVSLRRVLQGDRSTDESAERARVGEARFDQCVRDVAAHLRRIARGEEAAPVPVPADVLRVLPPLAPVMSESVQGDRTFVTLSTELSAAERRRVLSYADRLLEEPGPPDFPYHPQIQPPFDLSLLVTHPEEGQWRLRSWLEEMEAALNAVNAGKSDGHA
jgi:hypothetical protein